MKLSKYKQRHAEIVGALVALVDLIHEVKMGLDSGLELIEESAEIAATIDRDNRAMTLLATQRESAEKEMARVGELLQKSRDDLNKRKERSVALAKEIDDKLHAKRAEYDKKEQTEGEAHRARIKPLKAKEAALKSSLEAKQKELVAIGNQITKLKSAVSGIG